MVKLYESIIVLKPDLSDEEVDVQVKRVEELLTRLNAEVVRTRKWGKKRLAYEIAKNRYGNYVLFHFRGEADALAELDRTYKLNEAIIRFMTVRLDERHKVADHIVDMEESHEGRPDRREGYSDRREGYSDRHEGNYGREERSERREDHSEED